MSENEQNNEKSETVGNAAAMREAVETALTTIRGVINGTIARTNNSVFDCRDKLKAALSAPPRNCDVGTAEEQTHRMLLYCKSHGVDESRCFRCKGCPLLTADICELSWAQMPYEEQEGAEHGKA